MDEQWHGESDTELGDGWRRWNGIPPTGQNASQPMALPNGTMLAAWSPLTHAVKARLQEDKSQGYLHRLHPLE